VDLGETAWLEGIRGAARRALGHEDAGCVAMVCDASPETGVNVRALVGVDRPEVIRDGNDQLPVDIWSAPGATCTTLRQRTRELLGESGNTTVEKVISTMPGARDVLGIGAADPKGRSVFIARLSPTLLRSPSAEVQARWARVTAHWLAALRLRDALAAGHVADEAVLSPTGKVLHAEGEAKESAVREKLRGTARAIDRARGRLGKRDPDESLSLWRGLVDGRWSLVDRFEADGRRFLIARRNEPDALDPRRLSKRERQILAYVCCGYSDKEVAYHLGLERSTVSTHVARAMRKLGIESRVGLAGLPKACARATGDNSDNSDET
jgi:DNA-binding CsgD family transcriptional regulator